MFWNNHSYEAKTAQSLSKFKSKLASLPSAGLHYSPKIPAHQHVKLAALCKLLHNYLFSIKFCNILHSDREHHIACIFCNICLPTPTWKSAFVVCG